MRSLASTPAGLVATIVAARRSGDTTLEAGAVLDLYSRFDIRLSFGANFERRIQAECDAAEAANAVLRLAIATEPQVSR